MFLKTADLLNTFKLFCLLCLVQFCSTVEKREDIVFSKDTFVNFTYNIYKSITPLYPQKKLYMVIKQNTNGEQVIFALDSKVPLAVIEDVFNHPQKVSCHGKLCEDLVKACLDKNSNAYISRENWLHYCVVCKGASC